MGSSIEALLQQKSVRIGLGILCVFFAITGIQQLMAGTETAHFLRGAGNLLAWGSFAIRNLSKAYGREIGGLNLPINIGLGLIIVGWFA